MSKDLLKEVIENAKMVKATAYESAKLALMEKFEPSIERVVNQKLQEEIEDDDIELDDEDLEEMEDSEDSTDSDEEIEESELEDDESDDEDLEIEEIEDDETDEIEDEEISDDEEIDAELEEILRELEGEDDEEDEMDSEETSDDEDDVDLDLSDLEDDEDDEDDEDLEENEIVFEIEDDDEDIEDLKDELEESRTVIKKLTSELNEINLLNTKLIYSTRLFKKYQLSENAKNQVVNVLDRVKSVREAKIAYASLLEAFNLSGQKKGLRESFSSKTTKFKRPNVINESSEDAFKQRMQKLAKIIK